jgi:hypothetical protein
MLAFIVIGTDGRWRLLLWGREKKKLKYMIFVRCLPAFLAQDDSGLTHNILLSTRIRATFSKPTTKDSGARKKSDIGNCHFPFLLLQWDVFKEVSVRAIETARWVTANKKKTSKMLEKAKYNAHEKDKVADIFVVYHSLKSFVFCLPFARLFVPSCLHCIMHNKKQFRAASCDAAEYLWPMKNYHISFDPILNGNNCALCGSQLCYIFFFVHCRERVRERERDFNVDFVKTIECFGLYYCIEVKNWKIAERKLRNC